MITAVKVDNKYTDTSRNANTDEPSQYCCWRQSMPRECVKMKEEEKGVELDFFNIQGQQ